MKKIIVITGTSTGFGALMAKTFAEQWHTVIATMRNINTSNEASAKALSSLANIEVAELDVSDEYSVKTAIRNILSKYKKIDVLINNAAVYGTGVMEGYSINQIKRMFDINFFGLLNVTNAVLPNMRAVKDGLIINISSTTGRISPPFQAPYNASKFAVEGLVESSYGELIGKGVETILIEPGAFHTEIWPKAGINADLDDIIEDYGEETIAMNTAMGEAFTKVFEKYQPNPQTVADAALKLVNMEKGTRPLRTPVDILSNGIDLQYNKATSEISASWLAEYGF